MGRWSIALVLMAVTAGLFATWPQLRQSNIGKFFAGICAPTDRGSKGLDCR